VGPPTAASERREVPAKKLPGPTPSSLQRPPPNLYELKFRIILFSLRMMKITRKAFCVNSVSYPRGIAVVQKILACRTALHLQQDNTLFEACICATVHCVHSL
jgi:hypothetical protein